MSSLPDTKYWSYYGAANYSPLVRSGNNVIGEIKIHSVFKAPDPILHGWLFQHKETAARRPVIHISAGARFPLTVSERAEVLLICFIFST